MTQFLRKNALVPVVVAVLAWPVSSAALDADPREPIYLDPEQAEYVRGVMRTFMQVLQGINVAMAEEDWKTVAELARSAGQAAATDNPPPGMAQAFSDQWRQWGPATHAGFDELAMEVEVMGDIPTALSHLGGVMQNCVACHAVHRIEVIDPLDRL